MRFTTWQHNPAIQAALRQIPARIIWRVSLRVFTADPVHAGLHDVSETDDGRSYRDTCHVCYPYQLTHLPAVMRCPVMVLPRRDEILPETILHEFGHLLHFTVDFWPYAQPVTEYAETNEFEAFGEAFVAWVYPAYLPWGGQVDERTRTLLDSLAV